MLDGAASIVIGCILVVAALWLAYESRSLLVGEAADPQLVADIRRIVLDDPAVTGLGVVLTMHLGPDDVLLNIEVKFTPGLPAEEIHEAVHRIEERISVPYPEVSRIFIEVEALAGGPPESRGGRTVPLQAVRGADAEKAEGDESARHGPCAVRPGRKDGSDRWSIWCRWPSASCSWATCDRRRDRGVELELVRDRERARSPSCCWRCSAGP